MDETNFEKLRFGTDCRTLRQPAVRFSSSLLRKRSFKNAVPSQVQLGTEGKQIESGVLPAGAHAVTWDGRNEEGESVALGIYFCKTKIGEQNKLIKLALMR